jgi:hypothetical protein
LFGLKDSKRSALEHSARLFYEEVWNAGSIDLLDEIADAGVCFNDALGMEADAFSRASLKAVVQDFQASHPLLKYDLVSHTAPRICRGSCFKLRCCFNSSMQQHSQQTGKQRKVLPRHQGDTATARQGLTGTCCCPACLPHQRMW